MPAPLLLVLLSACNPVTVNPTAPEPVDPVAEATAVTAEADGPPAAREALEEGWGAVLEKDGTWYRTRAGDQAVGRKGVVPLTATGATGPCGEVISAPAGGMIVLPEGVAPPSVPDVPANQASLVERAAWRLDELLPDLDPFAPAPTSTAPARSRGVEVGSVAKSRRKNAPPLLIASGHRECTGVLAILDAEAGEVLVHDVLEDSCKDLVVLPPADLDGDGARELAAWSSDHVVLYRLVEPPGEVGLERLARWRCE